MAGAVTTVPGPIGVPGLVQRAAGGRASRCEAEGYSSTANRRLRQGADQSGGGAGAECGWSALPQAARARRSARRATPGRARVVEASISRSPVPSSITVAPGPACARREHRLQPFPRRRAAEEDRRLSACGVAGSRGGRRCVRHATAATAAGGGGAEPVPLEGGLGERPGPAGRRSWGGWSSQASNAAARQRIRRPSPRPRGRPRSRRCSGSREPR